MGRKVVKSHALCKACKRTQIQLALREGLCPGPNFIKLFKRNKYCLTYFFAKQANIELGTIHQLREGGIYPGPNFMKLFSRKYCLTNFFAKQANIELGTSHNNINLM